MNIEQVKKSLPDVRVHVLGTTITAQVSGRKQPYATVSVPTQQGPLNVQFSWEAVTRAVNSGKAVQA